MDYRDFILLPTPVFQLRGWVLGEQLDLLLKTNFLIGTGDTAFRSPQTHFFSRLLKPQSLSLGDSGLSSQGKYPSPDCLGGSFGGPELDKVSRCGLRSAEEADLLDLLAVFLFT